METGRIRVLPDQLVNQIAAGEVVEDPASVVKELVENSIDAGAARIAVTIEGAGSSLIRVADDGCGMSAGDAALAVQRHATSKIAGPEDLNAIRTLGFRGEALPSILSVSRFRIETRRAQDDVGTCIEGEGEPGPPKPCACAPGTVVAVKDLFFNVPARLKFLKGERSRNAAIRDVVTRASLAHPGIHFSLASGGRNVLDLPPCTKFEDRAAMVLGRDATGKLYPFEMDDGWIEIHGVVGDPSLARRDASRVVILVNGRPINDPRLRHTIIRAYSVLLPEGRFPVAVAYVTIEPAEVDVNVHPRKSEVRFQRPADVHDALFKAMGSVLSATPWIRTAAGDDSDPAEGMRDIRPQSPSPSFNRAAAVSNDMFEPASPERTVRGARFAVLRYIGRFAGTVLVCEGDGSLVLIDQHAAHERVNYDRLWKSLRAGEVSSERLLFPEVVELSPREAEVLDDVMPLLARLGIDIEVYSGSSIAVRSVPALMRGRSGGPAVRECLAAGTGESTIEGTELLRKVVATIACHASVRANDPLSEVEVRSLLESMDEVDDLAAYCPHGRRAVVVYPTDTVLRWFGR